MANKYKVLKEFVMNGKTHKVDDIIELTHAQEQLKSIKENIEKMAVDAVIPKTDSSVLGGLSAGQPMTPEQKEKLAKENLAETVQAQQMAADQVARDIAEGGREKPVVQAVADSLKQQLEAMPPVNPPEGSGQPEQAA